MPYKKRRKPNANPLPDGTHMRFAVLDAPHQEVLSHHHKVIGEAFNSMNESYTSTEGLLVVGHKPNGEVIGAVNHRGELRKTSKILPTNINDWNNHPFYDPLWIGKCQKPTEEVSKEAFELGQAFTERLDEMLTDPELNKKFIEALDNLENKNVHVAP